MAFTFDTPWFKGKVNNIIQVQPISGEGAGVWHSLPDPAEMSIGTSDLDSQNGTGRNQNAEMLRDRVATKEKIELVFTPMYRSDYQKLLKLTKGQFFKVKYFSDYYGAEREVLMYVGDRKASYYNNFDSASQSSNMTQRISMNFIEK